METTPGNYQALAVVHQVTDQFTGIRLVHHGAYRHLDDQVLAGLASTVTPPAILAPCSHEFPVVPEIHQRVHTAVGFKDNAAAIPSVPPVGTAMGNISYNFV